MTECYVDSWRYDLCVTRLERGALGKHAHRQVQDKIVRLNQTSIAFQSKGPSSFIPYQKSQRS